MNIVLRFEADAYDPSLCDDLDEDEVVDPLDTLTAWVSSTSVSSHVSGDSEDINTQCDELRVIRAGREIPQKALVQLKSRNSYNAANLDWQRIYPQMVLSQMPLLYVGVHQKGRFFEVQKHQLDGDASVLQNARNEAQAGLKRLRKTLEEIHNVAMAHGNNARMSLVCMGDSTLQVMKRDSADCYLPTDVLQRFE